MNHGPTTEELRKMFDIIISGGTVVDGTGSPGIRADVGINGERIESVSDLSQAGARRVIDGTGTKSFAGDYIWYYPSSECGTSR